MFPPRWGQLGKEVVQEVTFNEQWLAGVRKCQSVCSDKIRSVVLPPLAIYFTFSRFCQKVDIWICRPFAVTVFYSIHVNDNYQTNVNFVHPIPTPFKPQTHNGKVIYSNSQLLLFAIRDILKLCS